MILTVFLLCLVFLCIVIPKINNKNTLRIAGLLFAMSCISLIYAVVLAISIDSINTMEELDHTMLPVYVSGALMLLASATAIIKYCSINKKGRIEK